MRPIGENKGFEQELYDRDYIANPNSLYGDHDTIVKLVEEVEVISKKVVELPSYCRIEQ